MSIGYAISPPKTGFIYSNAFISPGSSDTTADFNYLVSVLNGRPLLITGGIYNVTGSINITNSNTYIYLTDDAEIKIKDGVSTNFKIFRISGSPSNIKIEGGTLNGNRANVTGVNVGIGCSTTDNVAAQVTKVTIRKTKIKDFRGNPSSYGIVMEDVSNLLVEECTISGVQYIPLFVKAVNRNINDIDVLNNLIDRTAESVGTIVQGGIQIRGSATNTTTNICRDVNISDNKIYCPIGTITNVGGGLCIETYGYVFQAVIKGNFCSGGYMGVSMDRTYNSTCSENVIYSPYKYGIEFAAANYCVAADNTIDCAGLADMGVIVNPGALLLGGVLNEVVNNEITGPKLRGIQSTGCTDTNIANNEIYGTVATLYAGIDIVMSSTDARAKISGNKIHGNGFIQKAIQGNSCSGLTVVDNDIYNCTDTNGLFLIATTAYTIDNIIFNSNIMYSAPNKGILTSLTGGSTLGNNIVAKGNVGMRDYLNFNLKVTDTWGTGAPSATDGNGSTYRRNDGAAGTTLYVRVSGAWVGIA
jgi:hypothetical protein